MKRLSSFAAILICGQLLAGCSTLRRDVDPGITLEQCNFEPNTAHYHDVLDELGPPARLLSGPPSNP